MKPTLKSFACSLALLLPLFAVAEAASAQTVAGRGPILQINAEGRAVCRDMRAAGVPYWQGKVRGRTDNDYAYSSNRFVVTNCFRSQRACERFVGTIHHQIMGIEEVYYAHCRPY